MTNLYGDVRAALRQWRRHPVLPATIVLTLASGIGAAIAVFAVTWAVLWRPIDVPDPARVVWVNTQGRSGSGQTSPGVFAAWRENSRTATLAAMRPVSGAIGDDGGTDRLRGALVTPAALAVLQIAPLAGRLLSDTDGVPGAARVLMISERAWRARYSAGPDAIGRAITLNGDAATIVGVLPPVADTLVPDTDWWAPLSLTALDQQNTGPRYLDVLARLHPGASAGAARDELATIMAGLTFRDPDDAALDVGVTPLLQRAVEPYADGLRVLFAAVIVLVLIAAINAAALLVTRTHDRAAELALRASIGASRSRLATQLSVEIGVLVGVAAAAGLVAALWITDVLRAVLPADIPRLAGARVDAAAIGFAIAVSCVVAAVAGLVPAMRGAAADLQSLLRIGATGARDTWVRRGFVVAQVALAVGLSGAGLMLVRTAIAIENAPRGYDARGVFTTSVTLPAPEYRDGAAIASAIDRIVGEVTSVAGVRTAAASSQLPFAGGSAGADVELAELPFTPGVDRQARIRLVSAHYLQTVGGVIREGREILPTDSAVSESVVVVNSTLARRLSPAGTVVGRTLKFGVPVFNGSHGRRVWRIVGVAEDTWDRGPRREVEPEVLLSLSQTPAEVFFWISRELQLAVRTGGDPAALSRDVRAAVNRVDPAIALGAATTLEERVDAAFARERLLAQLLAVLSIGGVLLAALGLSAIVDHQVRRRHREIAIRVALGASPGGLVTTLVAGGVMLALAGVFAGTLASVAVAPLFASMLFGVRPYNVMTMVAVGVAMIAAAAAAAWLPARRASRIDPAEALRS